MLYAIISQDRAESGIMMSGENQLPSGLVPSTKYWRIQQHPRGSAIRQPAVMRLASTVIIQVAASGT